MLTKKTLGLIAVLTSFAAVGWAKTPTHHGILSRIFHRPAHLGVPGHPIIGQAPIGGGIIGNTHSHVYHLPGDKGALPAVKNRRYFRTEAEAIAAGYHHAGAAHGKPATKAHGGHPHAMMHHRMMHH